MEREIEIYTALGRRSHKWILRFLQWWQSSNSLETKLRHLGIPIPIQMQRNQLGLVLRFRSLEAEIWWSRWNVRQDEEREVRKRAKFCWNILREVRNVEAQICNSNITWVLNWFDNIQVMGPTNSLYLPLLPLRISSQFLKTPNSCFRFPSL